MRAAADQADGAEIVLRECPLDEVGIGSACAWPARATRRAPERLCDARTAALLCAHTICNSRATPRASMAAPAKRPALGLELLGLGPLLEVALARVPLADHRSLGGTCRTLRRLIFSEKFERLRKMLGATEYGLLVFQRQRDAKHQILREWVSPTHDLRKLGFSRSGRVEDNEFTMAYSNGDRLVVCGDTIE